MLKLTVSDGTGAVVLQIALTAAAGLDTIPASNWSHAMPTVATPDTAIGAPQIRQALNAWAESRVTFGDRDRNARKQATRILTACKAEGWKSLQEITREGLVRHFNALAAGQGSTTEATIGTPARPKTIETLLGQFRSFLGWCVDEGRIQVNPTLTIRGGKRSKNRGPQTRVGMRALYDDEPLRLIAAAEADEAQKRPRFAHPRSFVYKLALMTGGRKGQLSLEPGASPIRWRDVCTEGNDPHVIFVESKNGDTWKVPLCQAAVATLKQWRKRNELARPEDFVFPFRVQDRVMVADLEAAKIPKTGGPHNRPANFHSLRKTFCTNLVLSGVPVPVAQRLMQHKTLDMTLRVYTEVRDEQLAAGVQAVRNFFEVGKFGDGPGLRAGSDRPTENLSALDLTKEGRCADSSIVKLANPTIMDLQRTGGIPAASFTPSTGAARLPAVQTDPSGGKTATHTGPDFQKSAEGRTRTAPRQGTGGFKNEGGRVEESDGGEDDEADEIGHLARDLNAFAALRPASRRKLIAIITAAILAAVSIWARYSSAPEPEPAPVADTPWVTGR